MQEAKRSLSFMMILSAFMAFASLSTDIYLPAMPAMQDDLGGAVALTITSFLVGFAIAQLVWGPISDHIGRRMPLAMVRDLYTSNQAAAMLSTLVLIMAAAPIVGPLLGAFLMGAGGWRMVFWLMATIAVLLFFSVHFLPETLPHEKRSA